MSSTSNLNSIAAVRGCSIAVLGCFGIAIAYRVGLVERIVPTKWYHSIVEKVETIKKRTEPPSGSAQYSIAKRHLLKTYAYAAAGFALGGAGIAIFFKYPHFPIAPAIVATTIPALALQLFPRTWMLPEGRDALFAITSVACGYTLGPMNWIAFDSMKPVGVVVGCTVAGMCVPLFLTRGIVSYFFCSQVLSCSLSVVASDISSTASADFNVILLAQLAGNLALGFLHTVPTITKCLSWSGSLVDLESKELDPVLDALHICANVAYGCWYAFRVLCTFVMHRLTRDDAKGASREERSHLRSFARTTLRIDRWSNALASLLFLVCYVRLVSYLQQRSQRTSTMFEQLRHLFKKISPLTILS